jgi:hypothetical protein
MTRNRAFLLLLGLSTFLTSGCYPQPQPERTETGRETAEAFFAAMQKGDLDKEKQYKAFADASQLAPYIAVFKDAQPKFELAGILGTTNKLYLRYMIRRTDGGVDFIRVDFVDRQPNADGKWTGDRIQAIQVNGKVLEPERKQ